MNSSYPEEFRSRVTPREKRALGDNLGIKQFGVNLTTLFPGKESSLRHFHSHEDEFIYILDGEVILRTDEGDQNLGAGMCAGFPAGSKNGHHLINLSNSPAHYLEIGTRHPNDCAEYTDADLRCIKDENGKFIFTHRDGSPY
jgi:uncharacterized cupin superfamily protein